MSCLIQYVFGHDHVSCFMASRVSNYGSTRLRLVNHPFVMFKLIAGCRWGLFTLVSSGRDPKDPIKKIVKFSGEVKQNIIRMGLMFTES